MPNWKVFDPLTWKFGGWPWKTIRHLLYIMLSFVHHSKTMGEIELELQTWNAQFRSKLMIFLSCVNLKFYRWPWKTIGHLSYATLRSLHHFITICEFKLKLQSRNGLIGYWPLDLWHLTFTICVDITFVNGNN